MREPSLNANRMRPWLRAALVLYLVGSALLVVAHQHHGAASRDECLLCTAAQTPAAVAPVALLVVAPILLGYLLPPAEARIRDSATGRTLRSRAPPQT